MKAENVGSTLVITAEYLKNRNGEKRVKDLQEKSRTSHYEEEEFHVRRSSKRKE